MSKRDDIAYLREWYPRIERMRVLGLKVYGFDPGVTAFPLTDDPRAALASIDPWLLEILERLAIRLYPETADDEAMIARREARYAEERGSDNAAQDSGTSH